LLTLFSFHILILFHVKNINQLLGSPKPDCGHQCQARTLLEVVPGAARQQILRDPNVKADAKRNSVVERKPSRYGKSQLP
jgi:hypothetical protein